MLLSEFIQSAAAGLGAVYPQQEARSMVSILVCERLGVQSWTHIVNPSFEVPSQALAQLEEDLQRLVGMQPLQYVLGFSDFYGRRFRVGPAVLIPRPETELLVDAVLQRLRAQARIGSEVFPPKILDLCTGSGCIAWTLALEFPTAQITAVDISADALAIARSQFPDADSPESSARSRLSFVEADVLDLGEDGLSGEQSAAASEKYDVIVSNPPYVMEKEKPGMRSNVLDYEPALALFVPDDDPLVFYRAIASHASRLLADHGWGLVEINALLADSTAACFRDAGFPAVSILPDLSGHPRFVFFGRE